MGYLKHPAYEYTTPILYDKTCSCEDKLTKLYPNVCFRCRRLVVIRSTAEERKCKHKEWEILGDGTFDPVCKSCKKKVAVGDSDEFRILFKDL